jgi:AP-3 complex subunit beta
VKRRVVKKAFYSDESDQSSTEDVYLSDEDSSPAAAASASLPQPSASAFSSTLDSDESLHPDHQLLLRSSLPLLKSRNSGVVLAVCSLHYYCGVSSIDARQKIGKALVRIHRDRREIQ